MRTFDQPNLITALPAIPTTEELQALITNLTNVAAHYSTTPDPQGYISRVQIIEKEKIITQALIFPEQLPNYHGLNANLSNWNLMGKRSRGDSDGRTDRHPHLHEAQSAREYS
jgi:hypothetical protein